MVREDLSIFSMCLPRRRAEKIATKCEEPYQPKPTGCIYSCPFNGPHRWSEHYPLAAGECQSPINIQRAEAHFDDSLAEAKFRFNYHSNDFTVLKNAGATWKLLAKPDSKSTLYVNFRPQDEFKVVEMHSHWGHDTEHGAEHLVDGVGAAMEIHIVHYNTKYESLEQALNHRDGLLVLAVFLDEGARNSVLEPLVVRLSDIEYKGEYVPLTGFDVRHVLPNNLQKFYHYNGSLTAPPCNECVLWIVFDQRSTISHAQVEKFRTLHATARNEPEKPPVKLVHNVRPCQPLNNRKVRKSFMLKD